MYVNKILLAFKFKIMHKHLLFLFSSVFNTLLVILSLCAHALVQYTGFF